MESFSEGSASLEITLDFPMLFFITDIFLLTCSDHFFRYSVLLSVPEFWISVVRINSVVLEKSYFRTCVYQ